MIVRLDKYLAMLGLVSRRDAAKVVKSGSILVDGEVATKSDMKLTDGQIITYRAKVKEQRVELNVEEMRKGGSEEMIFENRGSKIEDSIDIEVKEHVYVLLHKPAGYVCSEIDEGGHHSYKMLLQDCPYAKMLHVAGRLDRDTEGLVFCTNDGNFTHEIISPKKKEEKEYYVELKHPILDDGLSILEQGIVLDDGYKTMPAQVKRVADNIILLTIHEGKYHQVKRMAQAIGNEVIYLRRERIGERTLKGLEKGQRVYINVEF